MRLSTETILPWCSDPSLGVEAGCDEAGRGCLAGPVCAAAVILPQGFALPGLTDSKQLSEKRRRELRDIIKSEAVAWAVSFVEVEEIDRINILNASILGMHRALDALAVRPDAIAVDGNRFKPYKDVPARTFVKGDGRYANIAAASILAKTARDEAMATLAAEYPNYGWDVNKGYPTAAHRAAIATYGPTVYHRRSFRLLPEPVLF